MKRTLLPRTEKMRADENGQAIAADINNITEMMVTIMSVLQIHMKLHIQDIIIRVIKLSPVTLAMSGYSYISNQTKIMKNKA